MFQFAGLASLAYVFNQRSPGFARRGFPIRKSTDELASNCPWLIAGSYVLLRLSVPRHPPHALNSLAETLEYPQALASPQKMSKIRILRHFIRKAIILWLPLAFNCQRTCHPPHSMGARRLMHRPTGAIQLALVEMIGLEPTTSGLQSRRSPS
jgi:hypothetical protein